MTESDHDKAVWRRFADRQESRVHPPRPEAAAERPPKDEGDELLLAAWIDGRLEGAERETVEARLSDDPELLDLAVSAAGSKGIAAPWPKRAEARAAALVAPSRPGWRAMAAAAAAVVVVALGGFEMGRAGSQWLADDTGTDLAAELGLLPDTDLMETLL
jgi:anti-sigma-K factor RskA